MRNRELDIWEDFHHVMIEAKLDVVGVDSLRRPARDISADLQGLLRVTSRAARSRKDPSTFAMSAAFKFTLKFVKITAPLTDVCLSMQFCL